VQLDTVGGFTHDLVKLSLNHPSLEGHPERQIPSAHFHLSLFISQTQIPPIATSAVLLQPIQSLAVGPLQ
jgi:hypothetical protein